MTDDAIIREIRATREAFAAPHGYDVRAMGEALRRSAAGRGIPTVTLPPRPVTDEGVVPLPVPVTPPEAA